MTVAELIALLQQLPPDMQVKFLKSWDSDISWLDFDDVTMQIDQDGSLCIGQLAHDGYGGYALKLDEWLKDPNQPRVKEIDRPPRNDPWEK